MKLRHFFIFLIIVSLPLLMLLGSLRLNAFNLYFYESEFAKYEPKESDAVGITADLLYFLQNKEADSSYISEFSYEEQEHLFEVRDVLHLFLNIFYIALGVFIASIIGLYCSEKKKFNQNLGTSFFYGGIASVITILIFVLALLNFDKAFANFHNIFFSTQWQFPGTSLLIILFPLQFFTDITVKIILGALFGSLIIGLVGFKEKYINEDKIKR